MKSFHLRVTYYLLALTLSAGAQTALPGFTLRELTKEKTLISWINPYSNCIQLAVQRSADSLTNFRTIFSALSPGLRSNGFVDTKTPAYGKVYYRIFYVLKGGGYFFSNTKRIGKTKDPLFTLGTDVTDWRHYVPKPNEYVSIYRNNELLLKLATPDFIKFKDSINEKTKDTLYNINADRAELRPYVPMNTWQPSTYVFTNEKGYLSIHLPLVKQHHYRLIFYEENGTELFQVKSLKEPELVMDKTSFIHAGWFTFELFEDDKLKEKNKFYLQKP